MQSTPPNIPQLVLERMAVPDMERVYVLGSFSSPVTFSSQQFRAFNLIWALFQTGVIKTGDSVGIVGGGLGGVTTAAAALLKGCEVTLIEKAALLFPWQRGNYVRYVHPNILRWPEEGSETPYTRFPVLNWEHGSVNQIIEDVEAQWDALSAAHRPLLGYDVSSVWYEDQRAQVRIARSLSGTGPSFDIRSFSCVVLAVGFGSERNLDNVPIRTYWENDNLHQAARVGAAPRSFLVSGCGDGGLIDALRLRLRKFEHQNFVAEVLSKTTDEKLRDSLLDLENNAISQSPSALYDAYKRLPIPTILVRSIRNSLRTDTSVTLNSPGVSPLTPQSSALNRLLAFLLLQYGDLGYEEGEISADPAPESKFKILFRKANGQELTRHFDEVIVRHGPKAIIDSLVSKSAADKLRALNHRSPDLATRKLWTDQFYPPVSGQVMPSRDTLRSAFRRFEQAFFALYDPQSTEAIGISVSGERPRFAVWLKSGPEPKLARPDAIVGFPVIYHRAPATSHRHRARKPVVRLHIGSEIINVDQRLRADGTLAVASTILGCFVTLRSGEAGLLGVGHALAPPPNSRIGDRIALLNQEKTVEVIGTLHTVITPTDEHQRSDLQEVDVALAVLSRKFKLRPLFGDNTSARLTGVAIPEEGHKVFKAGKRGQITWGTIRSVRFAGKIHYDAPHIFRDLILIQSNERFSIPGDSGSLIVRDDGKAVGILFAGTESYTLAFPLATALGRLACTLITDLDGN